MSDPLSGVTPQPVRPATEPEPLPAGRAAAWIATLHPGYFALVMATGIVSIGCRLLGHLLLAEVLLIATVIGFIVLLACYLWRALRFPRRFAGSLMSPASAVGFFTVVAGTNVLATAILAHGLWQLSLVLGLLAFAVWLVLTYGLFSSIVLAGHHPQLREITGSWLVWVVGTQSVAVLATALAPRLPWPVGREVLEAAAVLFWSVGVVLYLILVVIIFLRLFLIETTPAEMGPAYWILMGATAISVRAAAGILDLDVAGASTVIHAVHDFVAGTAVLLWAFGSWFIPALVVFGLWRYFVRRYPWTYEPMLWSVVFPLGMYAVASVTLGRAIGFEFLEQLAAVWIWLAVAAWAGVTVLLALAFVQGMRRAPSR